MRVIRLACLGLLLLLGGVWTWSWVTRAPGEGVAEAFAARLGGLFGPDMPIPGAGGGMVLPTGLALGGAFSLVDQTGRAVTEADFAGRWLLLYFGYTFCPDVCPTELGVMAAAMDLLGDAADRVVPALVTIDPERDTPAQLADYVERFHPRMLGLTGTPAQIGEVTKRYRVYAARARSADTADYLMDHSSFVYLVGPDGKVRALFRPQTAPETLAAAIAEHLRANPPARAGMGAVGAGTSLTRDTPDRISDDVRRSATPG